MKTKNKFYSLLMSGSALTMPIIALSGGCKPKENATGEFANNLYKTEQFDQNDDGKIKFGVTFSKGKPQWNALEGIINTYNNLMKGQEGFVPVELENLGSGYSAGYQKIQTQINAKDKSSLVNLIANYNPVASFLTTKGMLLNFNDKDEKIAIKNDIFADSFAKGAETTEYINNAGTWMLPAMKSTNAMGVNAPVLGYVLETMKANGAKIDANYQTVIDDIITKSQNDRDEIKKIWGNPATDLSSLNLGSLTISESTFKTFDSFLDFADKAQKLFVNSAKKESDLHILGLDDVAGMINTLTFAGLDAKSKDFYATFSTSQKLDFSNFTADQRPAYKLMARIYDRMKTSMEAGSLAIMGGGDYTSNYEKYHKIAFGVGSTAGYTYNFVKSGAKETVYEIEHKDNGTKQEFISTEHYFAVKDANELKYESKKGDKYKNNIFKSTHTWTPKENFDWKAVDASSDTLIDQAKAAVDESKSHFFTVKLDGTQKTKLTILKSLSSNGDNVIDLGAFKRQADSDKDKTEIFFVKDLTAVTKIKPIEKTDKTILNDNEFVAMTAPGKWAAGDKKFVSFGQGPSIIGIHANEKEDRATKMFAKFLVDSTTKREFLISQFNETTKKYEWVKSGIQETAPEYLSRIASYIFPIKGYEKTDLSKVKNQYLKLAYETFSKADSDSSNYAVFEELAGIYSDGFREALKSQFTGVYTKIKNGENAGNYAAEIVQGVVSQVPAEAFK